jgi:hypothetical protein
MGRSLSVCHVKLEEDTSNNNSNTLPPLINGGTAGAIAAFALVAGGVFTQVLVMAEMASM